MMHIIQAILALGLVVMVTFAGISYFDADATSRSVVANGLTTQYEAILVATESYRSVNNGIAPTSIGQIKGFMPGGRIPSFGPTGEGFEWDFGGPESDLPREELPYKRRALCLTVDAAGKRRLDAAAASLFASQSERLGATVTVGTEGCDGDMKEWECLSPEDRGDIFTEPFVFLVFEIRKEEPTCPAILARS